MDYSQFSISKCSFVQLIGSYLSRFDLYILASRRSTDFHEYQFAASKWRFSIFRTEKRLSLLAVPTLPVRVCTLAKPRSKIRSSCPGHCIVAHHGHFQRVEFQGFMMVLGLYCNQSSIILYVCLHCNIIHRCPAFLRWNANRRTSAFGRAKRLEDAGRPAIHPRIQRKSAVKPFSSACNESRGKE